jgi:hypothetical protein
MPSWLLYCFNAQLVMRNYEGFMKGGGSGAWGKKGG